MNKLDVAYNYVQACQTQSAYEEQINRALQAVNPDNQVFGLSDPLHSAYLELVSTILGEEAFDWLQWWQYETDYGSASMDFQINGVEYNAQDMTLFKFLEVACGFTK